MLWPVLITSAAVVAGGTAADRGLAALATGLVARRVARVSRATSAPRVRMCRVPFVTQLLGGRYGEVEVTMPAFTVGGLDFASLTAKLTAVRAPLGTLLSGGGLIAGQMAATATVPFGALAKRLPPGLMIQPHGDDLRISGSIMRMPVSGILSVSAEPRQISLTPKVAGVSALVGFVISLPAMPSQLTIRSVRVTGSGLEVSVLGNDVALDGRLATSQDAAAA